MNKKTIYNCEAFNQEETIGILKRRGFGTCSADLSIAYQKNCRETCEHFKNYRNTQKDGGNLR